MTTLSKEMKGVKDRKQVYIDSRILVTGRREGQYGEDMMGHDRERVGRILQSTGVGCILMYWRYMRRDLVFLLDFRSIDLRPQGRRDSSHGSLKLGTRLGVHCMLASGLVPPRPDVSTVSEQGDLLSVLHCGRVPGLVRPDGGRGRESSRRGSRRSPWCGLPVEASR